MTQPVVVIENLVKRYKELVALDHLNLQINEGVRERRRRLAVCWRF